MIIRIGLTCSAVFFWFFLCGQSWSVTSREQVEDLGRKDILPENSILYSVDDTEMRALLWSAASDEDGHISESRTTIDVGLPDETTETFRIVRYSMMEPALQEKYPDIRTFYGVSTENPLKRIRIDHTRQGFRAVVSEPGNDKIFIDHYQRNDRNTRISYYKIDYVSDLEWSCDIGEEHYNHRGLNDESGFRWGDCQLRTYRLAQAATGEYSNFHDAYDSSQSALVMSAVVTVINRVNEVYEADLAVRLVLVDNTDDIFFYDPATDPYTATNAGTMLGQNINTCNSIIGSANYDIGHVFGGLGNNGVAYLSCVCNSNKAGGVTTSTNPVGDPFSIDYVSHEMGHQFGANHTQYNNCNRVNATAMEPGSASTIMGYAGICSPNVQNNSDAYFHAISIQEIKNFLLGGGNNCAQPLATFTNNPPVVNPKPNYTIPKSTPFILTLDANDPDGDPMTYAWEQMNGYTASGQAMPPASTNTSGPAFRSIFATSDPWRYFPKLSTILAGNTSNTWEVLPSVSRTMNFRGVVRDFTGVAGCNSEVNITVTTVAAAGPFQISSQNSATTWLEGDSDTISWDVAGTTGNGINCANVDILLSYDGGQTFDTVLASEVPNNGSFEIDVPEGTASEARVKIKCSDNIFLDINDTDITINTGPPTFIIKPSPYKHNLCVGESKEFLVEIIPIQGFADPVKLWILDLPAGFTADFDPILVFPGNSSLLTITNVSGTVGDYDATITGESGPIIKNKGIRFSSLNSEVPDPVVLNQPADNAVNVSIWTEFNWSAVTLATNYNIQISADESFTDIVNQENGIEGTSYIPSQELGNTTEYFWRVMPVSECTEGPWSSIFSFETAACMVYHSTDLPLTIPSANTSDQNSYLFISDRGIITDLDVVDLWGFHTWVGNLIFNLHSPDGTNVQIWHRPCDESRFQNFDINFDQQAPTGSWPCPPTDGGTYIPSNSINDFNSDQIKGQWSLRVSDVFWQDGGSLESWGIRLCMEDFCRLTVDNSNKTGIGSLYTAIQCGLEGDTIRFAPHMENITIDLGVMNLTVDKALVIEADISKNIHIISSNSSGLIVNSAPISGDGLLVTGLHMHVSGTETSVIVNNGKMSLHDVVIYENQGSTEPAVLLTPGTELNASGSCQIILE